MAYTDTVLAKNPIQYCTLTGAAVSSSSKDLTGNGYNIPGYTSSTTRPPLVPGQNIGDISTVAGPNPLGVMVRAGEKRKYSIELWATLNGWSFGTDNSSAKTIIQNDDATCKIYAENSFIKFLITDSDGKEYIASTNFNDWGQAFHLVASYSPDGFSISVNADISDSEVLPKSSTFKSTSSDLLTLNSTNFTLSHFAVYPKKLTTDEINSNYQAGKNFLNKNSAAKAMGANTYSLSMTDSSYAYQKTIRSNDFIVGNIRNLVLDKDAIKCVEYKPIVVRDSSAVEVSPDYTASPAYLPIASARHAKVDAIPGLSSSSGYVGVQVKVAAAAQQLLTIYSKAYKKSWSWYLDASRYLHLKITTYDVEDSSTSVIYDYQNQAPVQDNQKIWFTFDESGIKVSGWGTGGTPSGFNPNRLSGTSDSYVDNLVQQIIIDGTTELLFNTDESYAGSTGDRLYYLWIGSAVPASWTSDFTVLDDAENLSFWYDLTSGKNGVNAKSQGEWTYTFDPSFQSPYYGSFVDYDLANDGLSTVKLKYVNGSYVEVKKKSHFPTSVIPFSGSFGKHLITGITGSAPGSRTATTSETHGFAVGNTVTISGSSTLNETVVITAIGSTTFTYTSAVSGSYDSTDTVLADGESGPISVQAVLSSSNLTANRPELNYIKMYIYSNSSLKGDSAIGNCTVSGSSVIIKPEEENIFHSGKKLNCTFNASSGYIQLPVVSEGDYRSIEFTFTVQGTLTAGSVLLSSRNTLNTSTNQLLISASNVVTVSGLDWPSSAVYINGNLLSSGTQTALTDSVNHVLIIADRTTDKSLYLNSNYDNTLWVSGASKYSSYGYINVWDYALSADQITSILASRQGIISGTPVFPALENSVLFAENTATYINIKPWSADSVV